MRDSGGTLRTMTQIRLRDAGNTLRTVSRIRMRDAGNVLRVVYDPSGTSSFSASASPAYVSGYGKINATTASTTVTPAGGTAPYSHLWSVVSYSNATSPTITSGTSATTTFHQTNMSLGGDSVAVFKDTITDSAVPPNVTTVNVNAYFIETTNDTGTL
jgi:hypothetical protein